MATVRVNGHTIEVPDGQSVSVVSSNGSVTINGSIVGVGGEFAGRTARIEVVGCAVGSVRADGSVDCEAVNGSVDAGGSVKCGDVTGDVDAGGSVSCGRVGGDVDAGGSVQMKR